MPRLFAALLFFAPVALADEPKEPGFTVRTGHYEKTNSGLKDEPSRLLLADAEAFGRVFGTVPPAGLGGGGRKNNPVTKETFDGEVVAAFIRRGKAITTYTEVTAGADGDTLTVSFNSETGAEGTATFSSPLVVSVPKGKVTKVVFIENGKQR